LIIGVSSAASLVTASAAVSIFTPEEGLKEFI